MAVITIHTIQSLFVAETENELSIFSHHAFGKGLRSPWEYTPIIWDFSELKTCWFSCFTLEGHTSLTKRPLSARRNRAIDDVRSQQRSEEFLAALLRPHVIGHVTSGCEPAAAVLHCCRVGFNRGICANFVLSFVA